MSMPTFELLHPTSLLVFFSLFSPILVAMLLASTSIAFQHLRGLVYLGFLLGVSVLRNFFYSAMRKTPLDLEPSACKTIQYHSFGNATFSTFVFAFTFAYLLVPVLAVHATVQSIGALVALFVYGSIDLFVKKYLGCHVYTSDILINLLLGMALGSSITVLMIAGGSGEHLFFHELHESREVCHQPNEQSFRCSLYKDGELVTTL